MDGLYKNVLKHRSKIPGLDEGTLNGVLNKQHRLLDLSVNMDLKSHFKYLMFLMRN